MKMKVKQTASIYVLASLYSLAIIVLGLGTPFIISFVLFGLSDFNQQMVTANNLLVGIVSAPIIFWLTKQYYKRQSKDLKELDLYTTRGLKKGVIGIVIGLVLPSLLFIITILCGGKMSLNTSFSWLDIIPSIFTFFGMAVMEECIFRCILRSAFAAYGKIIPIIITALLFAFMHFRVWMNLDFLGMLDLVCAGIFFGVLILRTKSLTSVVIAHTLYNFLLVSFFGFDSTEGVFNTIMPVTVFNFTGEQVITTLFIMSLIVLIAILIYKQKDELTRK